MQKPVKKIVILIIIIVILPITAFFIYQFANLNESEEEINKIYIQQLETIIYSLNQYSEDVVSSWANAVNMIYISEAQDIYPEMRDMIQNNPSIKTVFFTDTGFNNTEYYQSEVTVVNRESVNDYLTLLKSEGQLVNRTVEYLKTGYQKIEAIGKINNDNFNLCFFPVIDKRNNIYLCGIIFDPIEYVQQNLVSKVSQICGEEFVLGIIDNATNNIVHSCGKLNLEELALKKPLWLIPGFSVGIKSSSVNLEDLVKQRYYENLIILLALLVILIAGILLVYQNLRRELRLTQLKADFVSNVSHELRTPLSLISMYSETLVLDRLKTEEKKKEYYSVINNESNRLSKIVNSILNFSKMESGTREYQFHQIDIKDVNDEVFNTYDYHIKSKGFNYNVKYDSNSTLVFADKDAISESMINLIENALKYSIEEKRFEICMGSNQDGPYWEIKDFGIGINTEDQKRIFEKFYRVSSGLVHNSKGTGLGLSLVKQIMIAHNGDVYVNSTPGKGSTFRLQFNKNFKK